MRAASWKRGTCSTGSALAQVSWSRRWPQPSPKTDASGRTRVRPPAHPLVRVSPLNGGRVERQRRDRVDGRQCRSSGTSRIVGLQIAPALVAGVDAIAPIRARKRDEMRRIPRLASSAAHLVPRPAPFAASARQQPRAFRGENGELGFGAAKRAPWLVPRLALDALTGDIDGACEERANGQREDLIQACREGLPGPAGLALTGRH